MLLRSFTLATVVPLEIIDLIIRETDSAETLKAWCPTSLSSLGIGGPLLNQHITITSKEHTRRVFERMVRSHLNLIYLWISR